MRLLQSCSPLLGVLMLTPTFARGQCNEEEFYDAFLRATHDGTAMQLLLSVGHRNFGPGFWRGNAVAFDVFRRTLGHECGPEERVTDQPLPWPCMEGPGVFEVHFSDPDVTPDTAYEYEVRTVDAERNPAQGLVQPPVRGYGVVGVALLAHGQLVEGDNFTVMLAGCPAECFPTGLSSVSPVEFGLPWGTTVNLYGDGVSEHYYSNLWLPSFHVTSISPATCLVAVEPVRWSTLKRLYK
jgi:hypothetical protein